MHTHHPRLDSFNRNVNEPPFLACLMHPLLALPLQGVRPPQQNGQRARRRNLKQGRTSKEGASVSTGEGVVHRPKECWWVAMGGDKKKEAACRRQERRKGEK